MAKFSGNGKSTVVGTQKAPQSFRNRNLRQADSTAAPGTPTVKHMGSASKGQMSREADFRAGAEIK